MVQLLIIWTIDQPWMFSHSDQNSKIKCGWKKKIGWCVCVCVCGAVELLISISSLCYIKQTIRIARQLICIFKIMKIVLLVWNSRLKTIWMSWRLYGKLRRCKKNVWPKWKRNAQIASQYQLQMIHRNRFRFNNRQKNMVRTIANCR